MSKFKVGDRVRVIKNTITHGFKIGDVITVDGVVDSPINDIFKAGGYYMLDCDVESVNSHTISTMVRKKIIPGTYGIVSVTKENKILIQRGSYTHEQLREAAHILNQIAEAMEDETTN